MKGRQTKSSRQLSYRHGLFAEWAATFWLWCHGYRIRAWRFKTSVGEIDIIATRGRTLVFTEVKYRAQIDDAISAILPQSYARLRHAATLFIARYPRFQSYDMRFDLIAVAPPCFFKHLDNIDLQGA